jgi:CheY-like chemotaxis protein/two-component sensor histidine kinase
MQLVIERQTQHLKHLIDDLLDVARVTQGKIQLHRQPVDLNVIARRCTQSIALSEGGHDHVVTLAEAPGPVQVEGDEVRLEQILNNLLTNAIKYTPAGGKVETEVSREAGEALLRVRDTGVGIEPELLTTVFDLFTQSQRALDRSQGGLGIGLTVTRSLVELHGGQISVHSHGRGHGCEFVVRLPLLTAEEPAPAPATTPTAAPGTCRVLIIEDNLDARDMLQMFLKLHGHAVEVTGDGAEGVAQAVATRPDVALVDIGLPGLNGYEVAQQLREQLGPDIHLIALTGYGQPDDRARALAAGFNMHLTKPVDLDLLTQALSAVTTACV